MKKGKRGGMKRMRRSGDENVLPALPLLVARRADVPSEGRMKALVTSHLPRNSEEHARTHTRTYTSHPLLGHRLPLKQEDAREKETKDMRKEQAERRRHVGYLILTHICPHA